MQKTQSFAFRSRRNRVGSAFTLMETVIAIGVLTLLLVGFLAVFTPAAKGIRRSVNMQQADRLTSALERELVTFRSGQTPLPVAPATTMTGFEKGFTWLREGNDATKAIFVYQYRGNPNAAPRSDGTPAPIAAITGQPGTDYIVQSMARRADDANLSADLNALEGSILFVKARQMVSNGTGMVLGTAGEIANPAGSTPALATTAAQYTDAVIAFSAEMYSSPSKSHQYLTSTAFKTFFDNATNPVFTRNLAIRR